MRLTCSQACESEFFQTQTGDENECASWMDFHKLLQPIDEEGIASKLHISPPVVYTPTLLSLEGRMAVMDAVKSVVNTLSKKPRIHVIIEALKLADFYCAVFTPVVWALSSCFIVLSLCHDKNLNLNTVSSAFGVNRLDIEMAIHCILQSSSYTPTLEEWDSEVTHNPQDKLCLATLQMFSFYVVDPAPFAARVSAITSIENEWYFRSCHLMRARPARLLLSNAYCLMGTDKTRKQVLMDTSMYSFLMKFV